MDRVWLRNSEKQCRLLYYIKIKEFADAIIIICWGKVVLLRLELPLQSSYSKEIDYSAWTGGPYLVGPVKVLAMYFFGHSPDSTYVC